jgi:DNA-directed RNA polymerase subunit M
MKFCEICGSVLIVKKSGEEKFLFCKKCGKRFPLNENVLIESSYSKKGKEIEVFDENSDSEFPTTEVMCPKCDEKVEAFWTTQQTRGGDEPPTRFYQCKKCKWRWREYS